MFAEPVAIIIIWFLILVYADSFGKIEARYNPVIDDVSVELIDRGDNTSDIWIHYNKLRDCNYVDIDFQLVSYADNIERTTNLITSFEGGQKIREKGTNKSGNWVVNVPVDQLSNLRFEVEHECHGLYQTISAFELKDGVVTKK